MTVVTVGWTDGGDCKIPIAFLKKSGDKKPNNNPKTKTKKKHKQNTSMTRKCLNHSSTTKPMTELQEMQLIRRNVNRQMEM